MVDRWVEAAKDAGKFLLSQQHQFQPGPKADVSLGHGLSGVALLFVELHRSFGDQEFADAAHQCLLAAVKIASGSQPGVGLYRGSSGVAWIAARWALECGDQKLLRAAVDLARGSSTSVRSGSFDVYDGIAGAIPPILVIARRTGESALVEHAVHLGWRLITSARKETRGWSWTTPRVACERPLTGYAHGASGVCHALYELFQATGSGEFLYAARQAAEYERQFFDSQVGNWRDLRDTWLMKAFATPNGRRAIHQRLANGIRPRGGVRFGMAWCHGIAGIAFSRLRAAEIDLGVDYGPEVEACRDGLRRGLAKYLNQNGPIRDLGLCHGLAGLADALIDLSGGKDETDTELIIQAADRVAAAAPEARARHEVPTKHFGVLQGIAGIGLFHLRAAGHRVETPLLIRSGFPAISAAESTGYKAMFARHRAALAPLTSALGLWRSVTPSQSAIESIQDEWAALQVEKSRQTPEVEQAIAIDRAFLAIHSSITDCCEEDLWSWVRDNRITEHDTVLAAHACVLPCEALSAIEEIELAETSIAIGSAHVAVLLYRENNAVAIKPLVHAQRLAYSLRTPEPPELFGDFIVAERLWAADVGVLVDSAAPFHISGPWA